MFLMRRLATHHISCITISAYLALTIFFTAAAGTYNISLALSMALMRYMLLKSAMSLALTALRPFTHNCLNSNGLPLKSGTCAT